MSANNWSVCPKCQQKAKARQAKARAEAECAYGKVLIGKYEQLCALANKPLDLKETLAEYYELGVDEAGVFTVDYRCNCRQCDYTFAFKHKVGTSEAMGGHEPAYRQRR